MHKNTIAFILLATSFQSCQVYKSPERKEFESESPQFRVQNLQKTSACSTTSLAPLAQRVNIIYESPTERVTEFMIYNKSIFESENLQGEYCVLSYTHE